MTISVNLKERISNAPRPKPEPRVFEGLRTVGFREPESTRRTRHKVNLGLTFQFTAVRQDLPRDWSWERFTVVKIADAPS